MAFTAASARHIAKTNIKTFLIFCFLSLKPKTGFELIELNSLANRWVDPISLIIPEFNGGVGAGLMSATL